MLAVSLGIIILLVVGIMLYGGGKNGRDTNDSPGTPRWVKVLAVSLGIIVLLVVGIMLFGGGKHGPGRHTGDAGVHAPTTGHPAQSDAPDDHSVAGGRHG